jgi:hypothetical protein
MPEETAPTEPTAPATPAAPSTSDSKPPWGEDFDAARAWKLVENLRADNATKTAKLSDHEKAAQARADAEKSEVERATARAERAEKALADREAASRRTDVLKKHGLSDDDAAYLAGITDDELDAKAEALAARLGLSKKDAAEEIPGKPAPKLTPGHQAASPGALDIAALVEKIHKRQI